MSSDARQPPLKRCFSSWPGVALQATAKTQQPWPSSDTPGSIVTPAHGSVVFARMDPTRALAPSRRSQTWTASHSPAAARARPSGAKQQQR